MDHKHKAGKAQPNLMARPEQASKKKRKYSSLSSFGSTKLSHHRSSQPVDTSGALSDPHWGHEQGPSNNMSDEGEAVLHTNHEKAISLTPNLSDELSGPAIPRRPRSERKHPLKWPRNESAAAPEDTLDLTSDSADIQPAASLHQPDDNEQRRQLQAKLDKIAREVVEDFFKSKDNSKLPAQHQRMLVTKAIFDARLKARQEMLESDPSQAKRHFFRVRGDEKEAIDKELLNELVHDVSNKNWREANPERYRRYQREYYQQRFAPSKRKMAKMSAGMPGPERKREISATFHKLKARLQRRASLPPVDWSEGQELPRSYKAWTQNDTNEVFKFAREFPSTGKKRQAEHHRLKAAKRR
ncbi:hypothetical protein FA10DRAFT_261261 [Acaromyces ingoldii]|uniref:Uncharacterized protein n=1 Tax=Acaromyces ingoldii TaxID=215250 RepID=A0A316YJR2_9BASI|nr:hypothetical protein FA10DRAFT_261261 [Acaromyces ingoldii]PWN89449.1 hypothetical protein FA10DRAFT_261261 [Acaromyces ingoldii]